MTTITNDPMYVLDYCVTQISGIHVFEVNIDTREVRGFAVLWL